MGNENSTKQQLVELEREFQGKITLEDKAMFLLSFAVRAPSTHNTQPWSFEVEDKSIRIHKDTSLELPQADPMGRDLHISLGCAIQNLVFAAHYFGLYGSLKYVLEGTHIATLDLDEEAEARKEFKEFLVAILSWQNSRGVFTEKSIPLELTDEMLEVIEDSDLNVSLNIVKDPTKVVQIGQLTADGVRMAHSNREFRIEMSSWMNTNLSHKNDGIPGYALNMPTIVSFIVPLIIRFIDLGKVLAKKSSEGIQSAPAIVVLSCEKDGEQQWLETGQAAMISMLLAQGHGMNTSIYVAAIEMGDLRTKLSKILGFASEKPQFLFALGVMNRSRVVTPRHEALTKLRRTEYEQQNV